jgi:hypothetical protein
MKAVMIRSLVAGVVLAGAGMALAEEQAAAEPKKEAAPKKEGVHAPKGAAERTTWHGVISAPATNAPADVVAVLAVKKGPEASLNLTATDAAVVAQLKELAGRNAKVSVKGTLDKASMSIAVKACKEAKGAAHVKPATAAAPAEKK